MKKVLFGIVLLLNFISIQAQSPWLATNTPTASRYDDVSFINKDTGWAVGAISFGLGSIIKTNDGGLNWTTQKTFSTYPRSVEFSSPKRGFAGGLENSGTNVFFKTLDGGATWTDISSVITATNRGVCGICCVDTNITYAVGVWSTPSYVMKTIDGGINWLQINMSSYASRLVDVQFTDANKGYVTGQSNVSSEGAVILKTVDGGLSWTKVFTSNKPAEYVWKIQNLDGVHWFASVEKANGIAWNVILKSSNGGNNWTPINVDYDIPGNNYLQTVGFLDTLRGWAGGTFLHQTTDGGLNWWMVDNIPSQFDRFQRINSSEAYLTGDRVYKLKPGWAGIKEKIKSVTYNLPQLKVFPNPTKSNFAVELILPCKTMYNLRLVSIAGNSVVWEEVGQKEKAGTYEFKFNQKLAAGEYFVYVMTNEGATSKKLIITD